MHELSLCLSMIDLVTERLAAEGGGRVLRIGVEVGALGHVEPGALAFCFDSAARGTAVEGARLEIRTVAGRGYCFDCATEVDLHRRGEACPLCQGASVQVVDGDRLWVTEMEIR